MLSGRTSSSVFIFSCSAENEEASEKEMVGVVPQHIIPFVFGSLNITYEFIRSDEFSFGAPVVNDTWTGEMGLLQAKFADVCVAAYVDYYHFQYFCPMESYQRVFVRFLASYGEQEMFDFFTFLYQVDNWTRYFVLIAFVSVVTVSSVSDSVNNGQWSSAVFLKKLWRSVWIFLASLFCEGSPCTMSSPIGRLLQFLWLFAVLVLVNVLYSQFKGILMVKTGNDYLHSVEDLANSQKFLPLVLPNSILEYVLRDSPLEAYRRVYDRALSEPDKCFLEASQLYDLETYQMVKDGTRALLVADVFCKYILKDICHALIGNRKFYFIAEDVTYTDISFYTNWGFPEFLRNAINHRLIILKEGGFGEQWFGKYYRDFKKCQDSDNMDENMLLELKHLHTAFILYFYLLFLSVIIFTLEIMYVVLKK